MGTTLKHLLIAVDDSENARRTVLYVADMLGGLPGFRLTVLNVVSEPPEDFFKTAEERREWLRHRESDAADMAHDYRRTLISSGFAEESVSTEVIVKHCSSIAGCILDEVRRLKASTVVMGRRGISMKKEFLFGSTSSKILHTAKDCAIWVVE
jgi:nucleotide-binding universal stress UspA family protein